MKLENTLCWPTGLNNCNESSSQDTEFSTNNIYLAKHLYRNLPTPTDIIVNTEIHVTNENDNKSQAPEAHGKDSSEIQETIRQLATIENMLHAISQARNLLEPCIAPQEIPSTIFTVKKVSKTFSSESAGQRLHRKAVERQRRFAARRLEAQKHASPRLHLVATESRRKSKKMKTYSGKCSKEPIRKCGTENNSVHTASTGTSRTMSTETSSNCSALKVKNIQMNQESNVYSRLYNNAKARTKRINDKKRNELECSKEKSPAVKVKLHTDRKLKPDSLSQKCLKQLEHDFRNNCEGSGKNEFQIYKNQFTTAMKLNYYKHKRETYKCLGGYKD